MKNLVLILMLIVGFTAQSQTIKMYTGAPKDTVVASTTIFKNVGVDTKSVQSISVQVRIDSLSGTPSGTATLYRSIDGKNYVTTGQTATWSTGVDTTFILTDATFYGTFAKFEIVPTASAQKSLVTATLKSWIKP